MRSINDMTNKLMRYIRRLVEGKKTVREIDRRIAAWLKTNGYTHSLRGDLETAALNAFVEQKQIRSEDRDLVASLVQKTNSQLGTVDGIVRQDLKSEIADALRQDASLTQLTGRVHLKIRKGKNLAEAVTVTARSSFNRTAAITKAKRAGVAQFRYDGPASERDFCKRRLGKVYTLDEIKRMDNGQGLPVWQYGGGYRCRHRWTAVEARLVQELLENKITDEKLLAGYKAARSAINRNFKTKDIESKVVMQQDSLPDHMDGRIIADIVGNERVSRKIILSKNTDIPAVSFTHEFGHLVRYSQFDHEEDMNDWRKAVFGSAAYKNLERNWYYFLNSGDSDAESNFKGFDYYIDIEEIFARSFVQYIANKSGGKLKEEWEIDKGKEYHAVYWEDTDFEEISKALDKLSRKYK